MIVTAISLIIIFSEWGSVFFGLKFNESFETDYLTESEDPKNLYEVSSQDLIPAILYMNRAQGGINIQDYMVGLGMKYERYKDSEGVIKFRQSHVDLVPCLDIYGKDEELAHFFVDSYAGKDTYSTSGWLCFPQDFVIEVQNDSWVSEVGTSTSF